jgi:hypothetical protein
VRKPEVKTTLEKLRLICETNIKTDIKDNEKEGVDWIVWFRIGLGFGLL